MLARELVFKCLGQVGHGETAVDHWPQFVLNDKIHEIGEMGDAAHRHAANSDVAHDNIAQREFGNAVRRRA